MGQAGAQREPSMEEILASIRKIIESNETVADPTAAAADEPAAAAAPAPAVAATAGAGGGVGGGAAAFVVPTAAEPAPQAMAAPAEPAEPETATPMAASDAQAAPVPRAATEDGSSPSLAAIAARMRTTTTPVVGRVLDDAVVGELQEMFENEAVDFGARTSASRDAAEGLKDVALALARIEAERGAAEAQITAAPMTAPAQEQAPEATFTPDRPVEAARKAETTAPAPEAAENPSATAATAEPAPARAPADDAARNQLISVEAGEKVAHSFAVLDAAMSAGSQRSFDEIAEDLLRPMLQAWLDDNLPLLVERLVREEIERVSRGPRR